MDRASAEALGVFTPLSGLSRDHWSSGTWSGSREPWDIIPEKRYRILFLREKFVFVDFDFWGKSNEWIKTLFFFYWGRKKTLWDQMNEWHVTISGDPKKTEKHPTIFKNHHVYVHHFGKKHDFLIWVNDHRPFPRNKYYTYAQSYNRKPAIY